MSTAALPGADDVHRFWFGEHEDWAACVAANHSRWFERGRELDAPVRERFADLLAAAGSGALDDWNASPRGALALVLTLDQFPRHIHRGSAEAFASDARALAVCRDGIAAELDEGLSAIEQSFFYLPLEHAEDQDAQEQSVALLRRRAADSPPELRKYMDNALHYAELHRDIIARFGRFPHRNATLGRTATVAEQAWLEEGGTRFGQ